MDWNPSTELHTKEKNDLSQKAVKKGLVVKCPEASINSPEKRTTQTGLIPIHLNGSCSAGARPPQKYVKNFASPQGTKGEK